ncbi:hypothetical protein ACIOEW_13185 [Streptomyces sp. NPDC087901]|uniref:hypothetical protein n=1 Tax=Streptomyces sp. NPDC087901 TaxID=3365818 RepID=UPI0037FEA568
MTSGQETGDQGTSDDELAALVEEFSIRKTYRPTDGIAEPDEVPQGPSGSAIGDVVPPVQGVAESDAP